MARMFGSGDPVQAGEFVIPAGTGGAKVLDILQHGRPVQRLVTVPEGMPSILVYEKLAANPYLTGTDLAAARRFDAARQLQLPARRNSGGGAEADAGRDDPGARLAVGKATAAQRRHQQARAAITLASIVEKETGKPSERRMVAGVYSNRLRIGMKLDADPTVIYPITKGKPLGRRIRRSELNAVNGYNTYAMAGLPIGPIANPGRELIAAVLNPAQTKALYFVADGTGGHVFADTLAEHNANVAKWYALRRQRGEM